MLPDASGPPPLSAPILLLLRGLSTSTKYFQIKPLKEKEQQRSLNRRPQTPPECLPPRPREASAFRPPPRVWTAVDSGGYGLHLRLLRLGLLHLSQWLQPTAFARKTRPSGLRITNDAFRAFRAGPQVSSGRLSKLSDSLRFTPQAAAPPHEYANKAGDSRPPCFWAGPCAVP